jgi:transposase
MTQYVGLDVSLKETKLHVLDEAGNRVWRGRCATEPAAIATAVRQYAPTAVRIGLETGPLTTWLWTALTAESLPMVCLDARHAKKALDMRVNKTDANDAEGLAHLVRTGWYREVRESKAVGPCWRKRCLARAVSCSACRWRLRTRSAAS